MLLFWKTKVTYKHVRGVVSDHVVVYGVTHPYHTWFMTHITRMKQLDSESIPKSFFLDQYTADEVHGASSLP